MTTYALVHPREGCRYLCWEMIDEDVAYIGPSSVYRLLAEEELLCRWKLRTGVGEPPPEPTEPNERWHTDIMYLGIVDTWYSLVTVPDACSCYVVHSELLLSSMVAPEVRLVIQQMVRLLQLEHIRIRTCHSESNGRVERFHLTIRGEVAETVLPNLGRAREIVGRWVQNYNEKRLHAALQFLPPAEYYTGEPEKWMNTWREKLVPARKHRESVNRQRLQATA